MPNAKSLPSAAYLRECFTYDLRSGVVHWRTRPRSHFTSAGAWKATNTRRAGSVAGLADTEGRVRVWIDGQDTSLARVIWKWMTGVEPMEVDHEDRDPGNNRWINLREAAYNGNCTNREQPNMHGYKGVSNEPNGKGYVARVTHKGRTYYAGRADTPAGAHALYCVKARQLHGAFHHP